LIDLFSEPLEQWTKYKIQINTKTATAWYMGETFITPNYQIFKPEDLAGYTRIGSAKELYSKKVVIF